MNDKFGSNGGEFTGKIVMPAVVVGSPPKNVLDKMFVVLQKLFPDSDGTELPKFTVSCVNGVATVNLGWDVSLTPVQDLPFAINFVDAGECVQLIIK